MKDLVLALTGQKHCPWCVDQPPSWLDRLMRFDQAMKKDDRRWYEKLYMDFLSFCDKFSVWKLGRRWHFWRHQHG